MHNHEKSLKALDPESIKKAKTRLPDKKIFSVVVACFKVLGDPTRAKILYALRRQPLYVRDLAIIVKASESAVSHQLRVLKNKRIVSVQRVGNNMLYSIAYEHISNLLKEAEYYADHIRQHLPDHAHSKKRH